MLGAGEKIGLALMIFILMLGMGSTLTMKQFLAAFKKPKALLIGLLSQFGLMPPIALGLALGFDLPYEAAISLIMIGCTPGGTTSNLFTYFSKGDVALSIAMTCFSTITAVLMMPICLKVYSGFLGNESFVMPYKNIISTLIIILIPVFIGMKVRSKSVSKAEKLEKMGGIAGLLIIAVLIVMTIWRNLDTYLSAGASYYITSILLGICGFIFGYFLSRILGLSSAQSRTVSLETGIQNTPLTMAIITLSFSDALHNKMLLIPCIYALFIVIDSCLATLVFRRLNTES